MRSWETYIKKNKTSKCYIVTESPPHQNVISYAENIERVEVIVSGNIKQETERIKNIHKNDSINIINLEDFGERNMMRDVD